MRVWPTAVALAAGGCEQGVAVRVDQDAAGIAFTLSAESGSFRPCLGTLELYKEGKSQPI